MVLNVLHGHSFLMPQDAIYVTSEEEIKKEPRTLLQKEIKEYIAGESSVGNNTGHQA